ncbi:MAG TPA: ribose 5-phosphate isomerase B [bacterium]|nr:MAG: ribose 5-phosphate isomerase B [Thermoprotei archaeon]HDO70845.1 ribose 5-phosphate isomerase B [bacterium]HEX67853.1 ribose 5-phosphate isomerase B [bacterium]
MRVVIGCDHAGVKLKEHLKKYLKNWGIEVEDMGTFEETPVDYPDIAFPLAKKVAGGDFDRGILICGTGIGMSIVANKVKGIRAAVCWDEYTAQVARTHNDSNILCLGGRVLSFEEAERILKIWIEENFQGGRHERRVRKILEIERSRGDG